MLSHNWCSEKAPAQLYVCALLATSHITLLVNFKPGLSYVVNEVRVSHAREYYLHVTSCSLVERQTKQVVPAFSIVKIDVDSRLIVIPCKERQQSPPKR